MSAVLVQQKAKWGREKEERRAKKIFVDFNVNSNVRFSIDLFPNWIPIQIYTYEYES